MFDPTLIILMLHITAINILILLARFAAQRTLCTSWSRLEETQSRSCYLGRIIWTRLVIVIIVISIAIIIVIVIDIIVVIFKVTLGVGAM